MQHANNRIKCVKLVGVSPVMFNLRRCDFQTGRSDSIVAWRFFVSVWSAKSLRRLGFACHDLPAYEIIVITGKHCLLYYTLRYPASSEFFMPAFYSYNTSSLRFESYLKPERAPRLIPNVGKRGRVLDVMLDKGKTSSTLRTMTHLAFYTQGPGPARVPTLVTTSGRQSSINAH